MGRWWWWQLSILLLTGRSSKLLASWLDLSVNSLPQSRPRTHLFPMIFNTLFLYSDNLLPEEPVTLVCIPLSSAVHSEGLSFSPACLCIFSEVFHSFLLGPIQNSLSLWKFDNCDVLHFIWACYKGLSKWQSIFNDLSLISYSSFLHV